MTKVRSLEKARAKKAAEEAQRAANEERDGVLHDYVLAAVKRDGRLRVSMADLEAIADGDSVKVTVDEGGILLEYVKMGESAG